MIEILKLTEVVIPEQEPQVSRDVKDNKFLAASEAAKAHYLVSEDRDLLDLTVQLPHVALTAVRKFWLARQPGLGGEIEEFVDQSALQNTADSIQSLLMQQSPPSNTATLRGPGGLLKKTYDFVQRPNQRVTKTPPLVFKLLSPLF